jgi:hypothetical protein
LARTFFLKNSQIYYFFTDLAIFMNFYPIFALYSYRPNQILKISEITLNLRLKNSLRSPHPLRRILFILFLVDFCLKFGIIQTAIEMADI